VHSFTVACKQSEAQHADALSDQEHPFSAAVVVRRCWLEKLDFFGQTVDSVFLNFLCFSHLFQIKVLKNKYLSKMFMN